MEVVPVPDVVSLDELKLHLRLDQDLEDTYLEGLLQAAVDFVENYTRRKLSQREEILLLNGFPQGVLRLSAMPVQEILAIHYEGLDGATHTLEPSSYRTVLDVEPPLILPLSGWPGAVQPIPGSVRIQAIVGYEEVPLSIKQAVLLLCGHFYENREVMRDRYVHSYEMPFSVSALLYPYKVLRW